VGFVLVPVLVRSGGEYLTDLTPEDFRLRVDGRPVAIESFEDRSDAPLSVVFLQDLSGSMATGGKLAASREALLHFLAEAGLGDEFALASFGGGVTLVDVPFTGDPTVLREAMATWEAYGTTALHDAVAQLPRISSGGVHTKRAAVLVTDGADNASDLPPDEAREIVSRAEVPVYVLGLGSGNPYALGKEGDKLYRYADVLNLLALYTGGHYLPVEGPSELKEAVLDIVSDLRRQYVLGFSTRASGGAAQHTIEVEVASRRRGGRRERVRVLARQGYFGTAPATVRP